MADDKKIVAIGDFAHLQARAGEPPAPEAMPEESLRLLRAFLRIQDPKLRSWLVRQSERVAGLKSTTK